MKGLKDVVADPAAAVDSVIKRNDVAKKDVELERLKMALDQNMRDPLGQGEWLGRHRSRALRRRSLDQIGLTFTYKAKPKSRESSPTLTCRRRPTARSTDPPTDPGLLVPAREEHSMNPFVALAGVTHAYGGSGLPAVEGMSIAVNEGEFVAIVGPSGCGKSTFMKLATGLQFPQAGTITVGGRAVTGPLKISGMAFQKPTLLPWRTTLDNVLLPLEIVEPHRGAHARSSATNTWPSARGAAAAGRPGG